GNQALARPAGGIAAGLSCDLVALDADHPALAARSGDDNLLNGWIFSGDKSCVRDVWIGGRHVVQHGRHVRHETVLQDFRQAMERLGE
ncbi:MAG TPA: formimidoylglutamate deiminase, partial [Afifellaceae bacterium]|nr:formimidoylglutamate deiminase [Afifellaceae bacterium]